MVHLLIQKYLANFELNVFKPRFEKIIETGFVIEISLFVYNYCYFNNRKYKQKT